MRRRPWVSINLLAEDKLKMQKTIYVLSFLLLTLLLGGGMYHFYHLAQEEMLLQQKANAELEAKAQKLAGEVQAGGLRESKENSASHKRELLEEICWQQRSHFAVLKEIEQILPPGICLAGIEMEKERLAIQGYASDNQELSLLIVGFREKEIFGPPTLLSSQRGEGNEEIEFRLEICWGEDRD